MDLIERKLDILLNDLTLLKKYEESFFSFLPLPTILISPLAVILEFNPAFEEISGYKAEEAIGRNFEFLFGEEESEEIFKKAKKEKEIKEKETFLLTKQKRKIPVSIVLKAREEKGKISSFFLSVFSLEKIKEIEEKIKETISILEVKVEARKEELEELAKILEEKVENRKRELEKKIIELETLRKEIVKRELEMIKLKKENEKLREEIFKIKSKKIISIKNDI